MAAPLDRYLDRLPPATLDDPKFQVWVAARRAAEHGDNETADRLRAEAESVWDECEEEATDDNKV